MTLSQLISFSVLQFGEVCKYPGVGGAHDSNYLLYFMELGREMGSPSHKWNCGIVQSSQAEKQVDLGLNNDSSSW